MILAAKKTIRRILASLLLLTTETLIALMLFAFALVFFILIAKYIFLDKKEEFDLKVFQFVDLFVSDSNSHFMSFLSYLANYQFMIGANLLLIGYFLFIRKHRWYSIKVPAVALGSVTIMAVLKQWFNRPRPLLPLLEPAAGLSFPSGHAMSAVTFYGLLVYFIWKQSQLSKNLRLAIITFLVVLILLIGLSRIYLRVHYASDVLGGFCAGIIWLITSITVINKIQLYGKKELKDVV